MFLPLDGCRPCGHDASQPTCDAPFVRDVSSRDGPDLRTEQELLGHLDVRTTMNSLHVMKRGRVGREESDGSPVSGCAQVSRHNHGRPARPIGLEAAGPERLGVAWLSVVPRGCARVLARNHAEQPFGGGLLDTLRGIIPSGGERGYE